MQEIKTITSFVKSLPTTVIEHMYHVSILTNILAEKLRDIGPRRYRYCESELSCYGKAAFFHDIGKALIPVNLLTKSGKFSEEEMESMKNHTLCAEPLFDDIERGHLNGIPDRYVGLARAAAVYHHEWWNGLGYPYGIGYEEIPLIARITSVCDAYDAITSNRCYKSARTHHDACCELAAFSGTQFDPILVQLFLDNETEFSDLIRINWGNVHTSDRLNKNFREW